MSAITPELETTMTTKTDAFDAILEDPETFKEVSFVEWLEKNPDGTRETFEKEWEIVAQVFGL